MKAATARTIIGWGSLTSALISGFARSYASDRWPLLAVVFMIGAIFAVAGGIGWAAIALLESRWGPCPARYYADDGEDW